jgi:hypothetical protein
MSTQLRGKPGAAPRPAPRRGLSFGAFLQSTCALPAHARLELFSRLPASSQDAAWRRLARECNARNAEQNRSAGGQRDRGFEEAAA